MVMMMFTPRILIWLALREWKGKASGGKGKRRERVEKRKKEIKGKVKSEGGK